MDIKFWTTTLLAIWYVTFVQSGPTLYPGYALQEGSVTYFTKTYFELELDFSCPNNIRNYLDKTYNHTLWYVEIYIPKLLKLYQKYHKTPLSTEEGLTKILFIQHQLQHTPTRILRFRKDPWCSTPSHSSSKRGLFDLGSSVIRSLFGIATDRDIDTLRQQLNLYTINTEISQTKLHTLINQVKSNTYSLISISSGIRLLTETVNQTYSTVVLIQDFLRIKFQYLGQHYFGRY